jgi:hypothetical protein
MFFRVLCNHMITRLLRMLVLVFSVHYSAITVYAAATQSIALAMYALFAIPGKIAAFTDNVTGHTELRTLC